MPLPSLSLRIQSSVFTSSALLLVLTIGMTALMGWFVATEIPREESALVRERALSERDQNGNLLLRSDGHPFVLSPDERDAMRAGAERGLGGSRLPPRQAL